jgi:hypothetical protein
MADNFSLGDNPVGAFKGDIVRTVGGDFLYMPNNRPGCPVRFTAGELRSLAAELDARIEEAARKPKPGPCPFCGSSLTSLLEGPRKSHVCCDYCGAQGPSYATLSAVVTWNSVRADVEARQCKVEV